MGGRLSPVEKTEQVVEVGEQHRVYGDGAEREFSRVCGSSEE